MKHKKTALITTAVLIIAVAALFIPVMPRLLIIARSGVTVFLLPLDESESFIVRYRHSVNRLDVDDVIEREGGSLVVRRSIFTAFGAGIPTYDLGESLTAQPDGRLCLDGIDAYHEEFKLFTGTYANHRFIYRGVEYALKQFAGEQTLLTFRIQRVSLIRLILYDALKPYK